MADETSPMLMLPTGEYTTDQGGKKPAYIKCQFSWTSQERPGGDSGTRFLKTLVQTVFLPGGDSTTRHLRVYDEDNQVIERDVQADQGVVAKAADEFEKTGTAIEQGTPIGVLNLDPAKVAMLKDKKVFTVEALRDVPDVNLPDLGQGARALRDRAIEFLTNKDRNADLSKLTTENEQLKEQQKVQTQLMDELKAELAEVRKLAEQRKRGG